MQEDDRALALLCFIIIAHIILAQYQMVENLGVRTIEMKDKDGNVVFRAKDGDLVCKGGIFQNVSVSGDVSVGRLRYKENIYRIVFALRGEV